MKKEINEKEKKENSELKEHKEKEAGEKVLSKEEKLDKELKEHEGKIKELTNDLQRLQAEFENYQKRIEREKQGFVEFANASLLSEFLPLIESFDKALESLEKEEKLVKEKTIHGIKLLREQFWKILEKQGIQEIKIRLGKDKFNHCLHEAMLKGNDGGKEENVVLEEFQKGYLFKGKVLRPSKVKINKPEKEEERFESKK